MRVFYIIKALQIIVAAVVIYRLLSVSELCDVRIVENQQVDTADSAKTKEPRPRNMDPFNGSIDYTILTYKDKSLEEIHEQKTRGHGEKHMTSAPLRHSKSSEALRAQTTHAQAHQHDHKKSAKPTNNPVPIVKQKPATVPEHNTIINDDTKIKKLEPSTIAIVKRELHKATTMSIMVKADNSTEIVVQDVTTKASEENNGTTKVLLKAGISGVAGEPVRKGRFRLKNTVYNCVPINVADMLGFGNLDLSHAVALRLPVACMIISILGVSVSIVHAFTNLSRPRRCRNFVENVAQVVLWTLCALALLLIRQDWDTKWEFGTARSFSPLYPVGWHCAEVLCYVMVVVYLVECYFYDYTYYKIYFEETLGNYTVVDRPEYGNSIYTSTVEMTEDTAL